MHVARGCMFESRPLHACMKRSPDLRAGHHFLGPIVFFFIKNTFVPGGTFIDPVLNGLQHRIIYQVTKNRLLVSIP